MSDVRDRTTDVPLLERPPRTLPQARRALRALWQEVEPFLTEEERTSLGGRAFEKVFPLGGARGH